MSMYLCILMSENKQTSIECCLYLLSILWYQHLLITCILHNCRTICHVPVCVKYNQPPLRKKKIEHCAGLRRCVKPLGRKNLEKTEYSDSTFAKSDPAVYFLLLIL